MVVEVDTESTFSPNRPGELFTGSYISIVDRGVSATYDVSPDGQHFAMIEGGTVRGIEGELYVIVNWSGELERLVPADN